MPPVGGAGSGAGAGGSAGAGATAAGGGGDEGSELGGGAGAAAVSGSGEYAMGTTWSFPGEAREALRAGVDVMPAQTEVGADEDDDGRERDIDDVRGRACAWWAVRELQPERAPALN